MKIINIRGVIGRDVKPEDIQRQLTEAKGQDIELQINSPGGLVTQGIEIFNMLDSYKGKLTKKVTGLAASMGSIIALAGKEKPIVYKNSMFMIHNVQGIAMGDHNELQKQAEVMERLSNLMARLYAKKSGKKYEEIKTMMDKTTELIGGDEILKHGFASSVFDDGEKDEDLVAMSQLEIEDCNSYLSKNKMQSFELEKLTAMLNDYSLEEPKEEPKQITLEKAVAQIPAVAGDNKKNGGVKIMNLDDLKNQHPALYAELFNLGKTAGKKEMSVNIEAHAKWFKADPENVMKAIQSGEEFTMAHLSAYTQSAMVNKSLEARVEDNVDDIEKGKEKTAEASEEEIEKAMLAMLGKEV